LAFIAVLICKGDDFRDRSGAEFFQNGLRFEEPSAASA
jgi:hypothetical protein